MDPTIAERVLKRADQLVVGDRIAAEYLPHTFYRSPGEVLYVRVHGLTGQRGTWVFVAYSLDDGTCESTNFTPYAELLVQPADPTGLGHSRADDGEGPQSVGRRVEPHYADGQTGVELDEASCQGNRLGAVSDCGRPGPHGPHGPVPPSEAR